MRIPVALCMSVLDYLCLQEWELLHILVFRFSFFLICAHLSGKPAHHFADAIIEFIVESVFVFNLIIRCDATTLDLT